MMKRTVLSLLTVFALVLSAPVLVAQIEDEPMAQEPGIELGEQAEASQQQPVTDPAEEPGVETSAPAEASAEGEIVDEEEEDLPKTASPLPVVALIGLLSGTAAVAIRFFSA